jgi:CheY-like chemotaxis protein
MRDRGRRAGQPGRRTGTRASRPGYRVRPLLIRLQAHRCFQSPGSALSSRSSLILGGFLLSALLVVIAVAVTGGTRRALTTVARRLLAPEFLLAAMRRRLVPAYRDQMPLRCLLVDDNDAFLETARVLLEREGVTVPGVASTSAEALRQARALRPDVILVDVGLGDENGFDLARLLAGDGHDSGAAVIMISACAGTDYAELIAGSPAAGFLAKSELSARGIRRILDRPR